jgi:hypothetical protein
MLNSMIQTYEITGYHVFGKDKVEGDIKWLIDRNWHIRPSHYEGGCDEEFHEQRFKLLNIKRALTNKKIQILRYLKKPENKQKKKRHNQLMKFKSGMFGKYLLTTANPDYPNEYIENWVYVKLTKVKTKYMELEEINNIKKIGTKYKLKSWCQCDKGHFIPIFGDELKKVKEKYQFSLKKVEKMNGEIKLQTCVICYEEKDMKLFHISHNGGCCNEANNVCKSCAENTMKAYADTHYDYEVQNNGTPCPYCRKSNWVSPIMNL